jgi:hypothetical protein
VQYRFYQRMQAVCRDSVQWLALEGFRKALKRKPQQHAHVLAHIQERLLALDGRGRLRHRWVRAVATSNSRALFALKL